jgi:hypothetical protein
LVGALNALARGEIENPDSGDGIAGLVDAPMPNSISVTPKPVDSRETIRAELIEAERQAEDDKLAMRARLIDRRRHLEATAHTRDVTEHAKAWQRLEAAEQELNK